MSTSTSAEVFYGFTIPREQRTDAADYARDKRIELSIIGNDGDITHCVRVKASALSVEIGSWSVLTPQFLTVGDSWARDLRTFCDRYGITWQEPAWHVAPLRL